MNDLHPDVVGTMAGLSGTDEPFDGCPSCHRSIIYSALTYVGAAAVALQDGEFRASLSHLAEATQILMSFGTSDFRLMADTEGMSEEDATIAFQAFLRARINHYVDFETGQVRTDHEVIDGDEGPVSVA